ncbi:LamG domain-containing protein [Paenibacillus eucommiae]|uniref:LamG-like jellyroll fold domain-containing protein n=1 Tax=Paenibacillus eucommiae TaxID=1355755 RepID=A0ABS4J072_9BACL|nr:LamG domain-containing protein [Paenibacillus eucommiae]MBP1993237.1 hypothetical protein [Paenibacillus eucommiae]
MTEQIRARHTEAVKRSGYWPLRTDCNDRTEQERHGVPQSIRFEDGAALFNGNDSTIVLPDLTETDGTLPFTMSLEFQVDDEGGFLPGGLGSRFSNERMEGWHLSVLTQAGVTSSQPNWRNLQFGWSTGKAADVWKDWGSPGNSRFIGALCVYSGDLYAGTFDDARDGKGRVHRLDEDGSWVDCGNPDNSNMVMSLVEYKGRLYAGTMRYKAGGSQIDGSANVEPGGRIYRYEGGQSWTLFAELPVEGNDSVGAMTVYDNRLIAMSFYPYGIFAFDENGDCEPLGAPGPEGTTRTHTLAAFQGRLFVGCNESAGVYSRTLQDPWEYCGNVPNCDQVYCFSVYQDEFLMGIWREARMYSYDGGTQWSDRGMMASELEVMGVSVFNGKLYGGTLPGGHVYRYNGNSDWELAGVLEPQDPSIKYRRVWSMAVYKGQLFAGTLPSGKVWSLQNEPLATCDSSLSGQWHRATVTYDLKQLSLYLDGQFVSSAPFPDSDRPTLSGIPLVLGQGPQCHFSGKIREVEIYDGALSAEEIADMYS